MTTCQKLINGFTTLLKINADIFSMSEDIRRLTEEIRQIDRRLIRVETIQELTIKRKELLTLE